MIAFVAADYNNDLFTSLLGLAPDMQQCLITFVYLMAKKLGKQIIVFDFVPETQNNDLFTSFGGPCNWYETMLNNILFTS